MKVSRRVILAVVWMTSAVATGVVAAGQLYEFKPAPSPTYMTGSDVGFRVDGTVGGAPAGRLVIRVNGAWVEVQEAPAGPRRLR